MLGNAEVQLARPVSARQARLPVKPRYEPPSEVEELRYPGLVVSLFIVFICFDYLAALAFMFVWPITKGPDDYVFELVKLMVGALFASWFYVGQPTGSFTRYFAIHAIPWRAAVRIPLVYFGIYIVVGAVNRGVYQSLALVDVFKGDLSGPSSRSSGPVIDFIGSVIVAPLVEEVLLRGLVLQGLLRRYSKSTAILISSAIFGVFHGNSIQAINAFVVGCFLGWLFVATRSLWVTILMHACHNLFVDLFYEITRAIRPAILDRTSFPVIPSRHPDWLSQLLICYGTILAIALVGLLIIWLYYPAFHRALFDDPKAKEARSPQVMLGSAPQLTAFKARRVSRDVEAG